MYLNRAAAHLKALLGEHNPTKQHGQTSHLTEIEIQALSLSNGTGSD